MNNKKDTREKLWSVLEKEVQSRGKGKDLDFRLKGKWKVLVREEGEFKIYAVDGTWIRNNLSVIFGHGGHGLVHEFIPNDEIWISTHHYAESEWRSCGCKNIAENQLVSKNYFESTVVHEITEYHEMKNGDVYWAAHQKALKKEKEVGLLQHGYAEDLTS